MNGEIIKVAIKLANKTQQDVADSIGITREYLGKLLSGEVDDVYVEKIKRAGVDIEAGRLHYEQKRTYASPEALEFALKTIAEALNMIKDDHKIYQDLIRQGVKDGTLKFIPKGAKISV